MSGCCGDEALEPSNISSDGKTTWGTEFDGTAVTVNPHTVRPTVAIRLHRYTDHFGPDALEVLVDQLIAARDQVRAMDRFSRNPDTARRVAEAEEHVEDAVALEIPTTF